MPSEKAQDDDSDDDDESDDDSESEESKQQQQENEDEDDREDESEDDEDVDDESIDTTTCFTEHFGGELATTAVLEPLKKAKTLRRLRPFRPVKPLKSDGELSVFADTPLTTFEQQFFKHDDDDDDDSSSSSNEESDSDADEEQRKKARKLRKMKNKAKMRVNLVDAQVRDKLIKQWVTIHPQCMSAGANSDSGTSRKRKHPSSSSSSPSSSSTTTTSGEADAFRSAAMHDPVQNVLFPAMQAYRDVLFAHRTWKNAAAVTKAYALHALDHVLKTRDLVLRHNAKLSRRAREAQDGDLQPTTATAAAADYHDQGFTRPRVLIVAPFRNSAYRIIKVLLRLLPERQRQQVLNRQRFEKEFGVDADHPGVKPEKPSDYKMLFDGNTDDMFRIGISLAPKSVKLFAKFTSSDVIVASPLGLRTIVGAEGEAEREFDFLSSIEVLIMDQTDVFSMQNWAHVLTFMDVMNRLPTSVADTDFSRVRPWYLDGMAKFFRQTIVISGHSSIDINALFNKQCLNYAGRLKIRPVYDGQLRRVVTAVRQIFQRVPECKLSDLGDVRYEFFVNEIFPKIRATHDGGTLIFIPSYFDYVRVRNYFKRKHVSVVLCSEYSSNSEISRSRSNFFHGRHKFMLVTERFHFFKRYNIRGIKNLVFYAMPDNARFYTEYVNAAPSGSTCLSLFHKHDAFQLERVVGTARSAKMLGASAKETYMFA
eukprot:TRINITY_DN66345_c2_g1_i2.p1 TRINITY_DN66345_c2_g1~~TRINITY_DN66345_c2_g1_i2.p1  ORF type:complete len:735 (-),score=366.36 TRINITY_DN66345_c2_g1_i2:150-2273(-)